MSRDCVSIAVHIDIWALVETGGAWYWLVAWRWIHFVLLYRSDNRSIPTCECERLTGALRRWSNQNRKPIMF